MLEGRAAIGYDRSYDAQKFYLRLALDRSTLRGSSKGAWRGLGIAG